MSWRYLLIWKNIFKNIKNCSLKENFWLTFMLFKTPLFRRNSHYQVSWYLHLSWVTMGGLVLELSVGAGILTCSNPLFQMINVFTPTDWAFALSSSHDSDLISKCENLCMLIRNNYVLSKMRSLTLAMKYLYHENCIDDSWFFIYSVLFCLGVVLEANNCFSPYSFLTSLLGGHRILIAHKDFHMPDSRLQFCIHPLWLEHFCPNKHFLFSCHLLKVSLKC